MAPPRMMAGQHTRHASPNGSWDWKRNNNVDRQNAHRRAKASRQQAVPSSAGSRKRRKQATAVRSSLRLRARSPPRVALRRARVPGRRSVQVPPAAVHGPPTISPGTSAPVWGGLRPRSTHSPRTIDPPTVCSRSVTVLPSRLLLQKEFAYSSTTRIGPQNGRNATAAAVNNLASRSLNVSVNVS